MTAIERGLCWACEQRYGPNRNRDSEGTFDFPICDECYAQMDRAWPVGLLIFAGLTLVGGLTFDWASEAWGVAGRWVGGLAMAAGILGGIWLAAHVQDRLQRHPLDVLYRSVPKPWRIEDVRRLRGEMESE